MNYEEKYWELREMMDRAHDKLCANYTQSNKLRYMDARMKFQAFCTEILEKLMEENSDVLARLK
jgi:hypothetical protein